MTTITFLLLTLLFITTLPHIKQSILKRLNLSSPNVIFSVSSLFDLVRYYLLRPNMSLLVLLSPIVMQSNSMLLVAT